MAELINLQQVLSMSGAVEKVQQVQQQQTVVHGEQFSAALKVQDDLKRNEVPTTEKTEEPNIREEYTERGGVKYRIPETASDINELMPIAESLNQLTTKAEKISDILKENIEEEKRFGEELQAIVDKKTRELNLTIQKAVSILRKLKEIQPSTDTNNGSIIDKYDEIFKLHDTGLSIKEIAEKVGASEGEV